MTDVIPDPRELLTDTQEGSIETAGEISFRTERITPADEELWLKMGRLRAVVYVEKKYITPDQVREDGTEFDEFDEHSDHFVAVSEEGEVIGTVRVINRPRSDLRLPSEEEFDYELPTQTQEISRLIRALDLPPTEGFLVSLAMMRAALKATRGKSETIYAVLEEKLRRQLDDHIGIQLKTIGDPRVIEHYNKTVNYLVEMEPRFITSQIHERDKRALEKAAKNERFAESILGKPFASFFERDNATQGLGRVSLGDLTAPNPAQYERNNGFYSPEEQQRLWNSTVALAGAGGDGGQLAVTMAMAGVRNFRLADPEDFSIENLNRQTGASLATIGRNKAEVIAGMLRDLGATVEVFPMGINEDNIEAFTKGADLIFDETEFTMPQLGVMIARSARAHNIPVLMALNVGFGSYTTSFAPDGMTFEEYLGIDPSLSLEEITKWAEDENHTIPIDKWAPHIPSYANVEVLSRVVKGEISAPTVVQGVMMAAGDAGTQGVAHLLKEVNPDWEKWITWAPHGKGVDAKDGSFEVKSRGFHFKTSVAIAALRTKLGKSHPKHSS